MKSTRFKMLIWLLLLVVYGIAPAAAQTQSGRSSDDESVRALVKQAVSAQANFDAPALEKIYASDYLEVSPIGGVDPRDKAIGFYKPQASGANQVKPAVSADEFQIRFYRDVAVVVSRITFSQEGSATPQRPPISFRATHVCRKEGGRWKISSVQVTGIRPPRPPQQPS
jgi:uncharacterized protein (TIGR02246 family)